ncbi:MAG: TonB-dependent receptor [Sphingomonadaceae bacterium]
MRAFILMGTAIALLATPAVAQQVVSDAPSDPLADIVVTAQKREERLQDVPVAVSVLSGSMLEAQGGATLENAQYLIPTLNFRKSGTTLNQALFLRGVGTINFSIAAEPSVAAVLDGVVLQRAGEGFGDLVDIERIEVLRGPQGTLFGKNASAGVVNIVTRRPTDRFEGYAEGSFFFDNGNEYRLRGGINIPFTPDVRGRFTAFWGEYEGNYFNTFTGKRVNGYDRWGLRGTIEADIAPGATLRFIGDYRRANDDCCAESIGQQPTNNARFILPADSFRGNRSTTVAQNLVTATKEESWGLSMQADIDAGNLGTVTSITAFRKWKNTEIRDGDWISAPIVGVPQLHDDGPQSSDTFSQELRLASPTGQMIEYVVGAYYSKATNRRVFTRNVILCNTPPTPVVGIVRCGETGSGPVTFPSGSADFGSKFDNLAFFGQASWNINEMFTLIGGLRYTYDVLSVDHIRRTTLAGPGIQPNFDQGVFAGTGSNGIPFRAKTSNDNWSGRLGAQVRLNDNHMLYGTYARGYKGPAYNIFFNLTAIGTNVIAPETVDSFEVGLKNTLLDGRVVLNLAGFYAKYENYQANNPDIVAGVVVTRLTNAGEVSTRGFELDLLARPTDTLSVSGGLAYTDARVDSFRLPPGGNPTQVIPSGTPLANAPKWKASLAADNRFPLGGVDLIVGGALAYQSSQLSEFSANPAVRAATTIGGYAIVDASVAVADPDDRFRLTFQVRNLFDEQFAASITSGGPGGSFRYIIPRESGRFFGLTGRVNLGR